MLIVDFAEATTEWFTTNYPRHNPSDTQRIKEWFFTQKSMITASRIQFGDGKITIKLQSEILAPGDLRLLIQMVVLYEGAKYVLVTFGAQLESESYPSMGDIETSHSAYLEAVFVRV